MRALILGATGLVGGWCLKFLLEDPDFTQVIAAGRAPVAPAPRLTFESLDFERLAGRPLPKADAILCCLGTTLRKAGSPEAFRRVDYDYVLQAAHAGLAGGARKFLLVSSQGADPASPFLYPRVKGEIERDVAALPFKSVHILRPGLLLGERREARPVEAAAQKILRKLSFVLAGPLRRFRPIPARSVGLALARIAKLEQSGTRVWSCEEVAAFAAGEGL